MRYFMNGLVYSGVKLGRGSREGRDDLIYVKNNYIAMWM